MVVAKKQIPELVTIIENTLYDQDYLLVIVLKKFRKTEAYAKNKSFRETVDLLIKALLADTKKESVRPNGKRKVLNAKK